MGCSRGKYLWPSVTCVVSVIQFNRYNVYLLQLGCNPVAVVILHVY